MVRFAARCWKNCATCEYWLGPRRLNEVMVAAEAAEMAQGPCEVRGEKTYAITSCIRWRRWSALKPNARAPRPTPTTM